MEKGYVLVTLVCLVAAGYAFGEGPGNIAVTKHNLSASGGQTIRASSPPVEEICVFCHTPHMALTGTPLWNHTLSNRSTYTVYSSPTLLSQPQNPPDGDSRLCLSCHDGDQPLGSLVNLGGRATTITMTQELPTPGAGSTNFGADLSGHHPVSIEVMDRLKECKDLHPDKGCPSLTVDWTIQATIDPTYLKPTSNSFDYSIDCSTYGTSVTHTGRGVQCSSCHDAHSSNSMFLRAVGQWNPPSYDALCTACHQACL